MIVSQSGGSSVIFSEWTGIFKENEVPTSLKVVVAVVVLYGRAQILKVLVSKYTSQIVWYCGVVFWHSLSSHLGNSQMDYIWFVSICHYCDNTRMYSV